MSNPDITIVIPIYNNRKYICSLLQYLNHSVLTEPPFKVIVVDDGSTDGSYDAISNIRLAYPIEVYQNKKNMQYAATVNNGAKHCTTKYLVTLNVDTMPLPGWLASLYDHALSNPTTILQGSKLLYPKDHSIQHAGVAFNKEKMPFHIYRYADSSEPCVNKKRRFKAVTGAVWFIEMKDYANLLGLEECYRNGWEDIDFCLKATQKYPDSPIIYNPDSVLYHHESVSENRDSWENDNISLFKKKWSDFIVQDDLMYFREDGVI